MTHSTFARLLGMLAFSGYFLLPDYCARAQVKHKEPKPGERAGVAAQPADGQKSNLSEHTKAGWNLLMNAKPVEAIPVFDQALKANPSDVLALLGRANALMSTGNFELAIATATRAVEIAPSEKTFFAAAV